MPKPGMSRNVSNPQLTASAALASVASVASGSRQTPETCQMSMDPNRLAPRGSANRGGTAAVERNEVMEEQGRKSDTESTRFNYGERKKLFSGL